MYVFNTTIVQCRGSWWKIVLHFYYNCSGVSGTILLVIQRTELHVQEQQKLRTAMNWLCHRFQVITRPVWQSDHRSLVFRAYGVGAVLALHMSSYNLKLLKGRCIVLQVYCKRSHKMFTSAINWVYGGITQAIKHS